MRIFRGTITELSENQIFVFGSNEAGIHGAGAAKHAMKFGAILGQGYGRQGNTFAIPTKDRKIETLSLLAIKNYVNEFLAEAEEESKKDSSLDYFVTNIGCGLAGYTPYDIAPMFFEKCSKPYLVFSEEFVSVFFEMNNLLKSIPLMGVFSKDCMEFFLTVLRQHPKAELYYDNDHIICKVWDLYIDKTGVAEPSGYLHWSEYGKQQFNRFELSPEGRAQLDNYLCKNTQ